MQQKIHLGSTCVIVQLGNFLLRKLECWANDFPSIFETRTEKKKSKGWIPPAYIPTSSFVWDAVWMDESFTFFRSNSSKKSSFPKIKIFWCFEQKNHKQAGEDVFKKRYHLTRVLLQNLLPSLCLKEKKSISSRTKPFFFQKTGLYTCEIFLTQAHSTEILLWSDAQTFKFQNLDVLLGQCLVNVEKNAQVWVDDVACIIKKWARQMGFIVATSVALGFQVNAPKKWKKVRAYITKCLFFQALNSSWPNICGKSARRLKLFVQSFSPKPILRNRPCRSATSHNLNHTSRRTETVMRW